MGFIDWFKQAGKDAGNWLQQNIAKPASAGISWVNQNLVQPVAKIAKDIPGVGQIAEAVSTGANAVDALGKSAASGNLSTQNIADTYGTLKNSYNQVRQNIPNAQKELKRRAQNVRDRVANFAEGGLVKRLRSQQ